MHLESSAYSNLAVDPSTDRFSDPLQKFFDPLACYFGIVPRGGQLKVAGMIKDWYESARASRDNIFQMCVGIEDHRLPSRFREIQGRVGKHPYAADISKRLNDTFFKLEVFRGIKKIILEDHSKLSIIDWLPTAVETEDLPGIPTFHDDCAHRVTHRKREYRFCLDHFVGRAAGHHVETHLYDAGGHIAVPIAECT